MRIFKIYSCSYYEDMLDLIGIEVSITHGLNHLEVIGLPDTLQKEYRVKLKKYFRKHFEHFPRGRIHIHLEGLSNKRKDYCGDFFLPIVLALKILTSKLSCPAKIFAYGDVNLEEEVLYSPSSLVYIEQLFDLLKKQEFDFCFLPCFSCPKTFKSFLEKKLEGLSVIFLKKTEELLKVLKTNKPFNKALNLPRNTLDFFDDIQNQEDEFQEKLLPLSILKNQSFALEALLLACAGYHALLFVGSVGCGKTQLAFWARELLPFEEEKELFYAWIKTSMYRSFFQEEGIYGSELKKTLFYITPAVPLKVWKMIQQSFKDKFLTQGTIMLWDEIQHLEKNRIQFLFQVLDVFIQEHQILHIACANLCPCGQLLEKEKMCLCSRGQIMQYQKKLNAALLNRFDLKVEMSQPKVIETLNIQEERTFLLKLKSRLKTAEKMRKERGQPKRNAFLNENTFMKYAYMADSLKERLSELYKTLNLNARSFYKLLKLARTQADLLGELELKEEHLWMILAYVQPVESALVYLNIKENR